MGARRKLEGHLSARKLLKPRDGGEPKEVAVAAGVGTLRAVKIGGASFEVEPGAGFFRRDGAVVPYYAAREKDAIQVWVGGRIYRFDLTAPGAAGAQAASAALHSGEVAAQMPGRILKLLVRVGESVESDQPLIVMESMKMEMTLAAPFSAKVAAVNCAVDDRVEMGQILLTLKTPGDANK